MAIFLANKRNPFEEVESGLNFSIIMGVTLALLIAGMMWKKRKNKPPPKSAYGRLPRI